MKAIIAEGLTKTYKVSKKEPGFSGSIASLFSKKKKGIKAVDHISFEIEEGELVGLIGQNGAGKTTTLKMLSGILYPSSGSAKVLGFVPWERKNKFKKQIAFIAGQRNQLWWDLPPIDSFLLNKEIYEISKNDYEKRLSHLSSLLQLDTLLTTPVKKLSLGQRMKAELVASLLHNPKLLYLDEPTIGLDVIAQGNMHTFIKEYNRQNNATIVMTSHYMKDVEKLCERIIIIDNGKIIYDGKLSKIVDKFSRKKLIKIIVDDSPTKQEVENFGDIIDYSLPQITIEIERGKTTRIAQELFKKYKIKDLTIEDPPIEEIIKTIFTDSHA